VRSWCTDRDFCHIRARKAREEKRTRNETGKKGGIRDGLNTMEGGFAKRHTSIQEPAYKYLQSMYIFTSASQAMIISIIRSSRQYRQLSQDS